MDWGVVVPNAGMLVLRVLHMCTCTAMYVGLTGLERFVNLVASFVSVQVFFWCRPVYMQDWVSTAHTHTHTHTHTCMHTHAHAHTHICIDR